MLSGFGVALILAGLVLATARGWVIRNITSRSLGSLAPGFAATPGGYLVYCYLVFDIGWFVVALAQGIAILLAITVVTFVVATVVVVVGEYVVFRRLKR